MDEVGEDLEVDMWERSTLLSVNDSASCAKLSIIQFKILHHIHDCKGRLATGGKAHMFQSCPVLSGCIGLPYTDVQTNAVMARFGTSLWLCMCVCTNLSYEGRVYINMSSVILLHLCICTILLMLNNYILIMKEHFRSN